MKPDPAIHAALRLCLAALFVSAALHKLRGPARFRAALDAYDILPQRAHGVVARALPWLEAAIAAGLLGTGSFPVAAAAAGLLLCVYTAAIAINVLRGRRDIDCGCGVAGARQSIGPGLLMRNLARIACSGAVACGAGDRLLHAADAVTVVAASLAAMLLWTAAAQLSALPPLSRRSKDPR